MDLKQYVSEVQDWPKPGVSFKDITTIMDNGEAYGYANRSNCKVCKRL